MLKWTPSARHKLPGSHLPVADNTQLAKMMNIEEKTLFRSRSFFLFYFEIFKKARCSYLGEQGVGTGMPVTALHCLLYVTDVKRHHHRIITMTDTVQKKVAEHKAPPWDINVNNSVNKAGARKKTREKNGVHLFPRSEWMGNKNQNWWWWDFWSNL